MREGAESHFLPATYFTSPQAADGGSLPPAATFGILPRMEEPASRFRSLRPRKWAILAAAIAICGIVAALFVARKTVTVIVDGGAPMEVTTYASSISGALRAAGLELQPADEVTPSRQERIADGDVIRLKRAFRVLVKSGESHLMVDTTADSAAGILSAAGLQFSTGDRVWVDGILIGDPEADLARHPFQMRLEQGVPFSLRLNGAPRELRSAAPTVAGGLWEDEVRLYQGDFSAPSPESALTAGAKIAVDRASPLTVSGGDKRYAARLAAETVGDALRAMDIPLTGLDYARPPQEAPVPASRHIEVVHRVEKVIIEQEPLPFDTQFEADPDLEIDNQRILSAGAYGILARQMRVRLDNGEEVGRLQDQEWVARDADPRLIGYGTRVVVRSKGTPDGNIEYWRAVVMHATSYSPCRVGGDTCSNTTATGDRLRKGVVAVSVRWFPYMVGARVYVPGYGFGTVLDNGAGGPWARWIDLGYSDSNYEPWSEDVTVYFLTPVPKNILYILN